MGSNRPNERPLTAKQLRFVSEYLIDCNATQACIRAGYKARNADVVGPQLLGKTWVAEAIAEAMQARSDRTGIQADQVLRELVCIARVDVVDAFTDQGALKSLSEMPEDVRRAIASIESSECCDRGNTVEIRKLRFWDKVRALELLGKHLRLWHERAEDVKLPTFSLQFGAGIEPLDDRGIIDGRREEAQ